MSSGNETTTYVIVITTDDDTMPTIIRKACESMVGDITEDCVMDAVVVHQEGPERMTVTDAGEINAPGGEWVYGTTVTA